MFLLFKLHDNTIVAMNGDEIIYVSYRKGNDALLVESELLIMFSNNLEKAFYGEDADNIFAEITRK